MKKGYYFLLSVLVFAVSFLIAQPAAAVTGPVTVNSVTVSSTTSGATGVTMTVALTVNQELSIGTNVTFASWLNGYCPPGMNCGFDFSGATVSGISGNVNQQTDWVSVNLTSAVATGPLTVTLGNLTNPTPAGAFIVVVDINGSMNTATTPLYMGNLAVVGRVTKPDGSGVNGAGVNIRTQDFSFNTGSGTDQNGYYAIPVVTDRGTFASGTTYFVEVWPGPDTEGVVPPDPVSFVYGGSTVTKNLQFVTASKTINVIVQYTDGTRVSVANVWANRRGGGGGAGGDVASDGTKTLSVSGGSWDVSVNCPWDPVNNRPMSCDWAYNQPPTPVDFSQDSSSETRSITFTVIKASAIIKGKVVKPNGSPLSGGFVNIQKEGSMGMGTGINGSDGSFLANVPAGDYKVSINPDMMNPDLARYYSSEIAVRVGDNETKDLGTITMKEKSSVITGRILDESGNGVSGVRVNTWLRGGMGWSNTTSGSDGTFTLYVFAGEWDVNLDNGPQAGNYIPLENRPYPVTIADNQTVSGVNIRVKLADAAILVKLVDASGNAIPNMFGYAFARIKDGGFGPGSEFGAGIDRSTATIRLLGGKTYVVGVHMPPDAGVGFSLREEVEVPVAIGETKEVKLTLVPNDATISGFVKDQYGSLVRNIDAEVFVMDQNWQWRGTKLNADGSFLFSVRGGKQYMAGVNFRGMRGTSGYVETHPKPGDSFLVPENSTYTKIITVLKADSVISGVVKAPDGSMMSRVWVNANNFRSMENKIKADVESAQIVDTGTEAASDGTFSLAVVAGQYDIHSGLPPEFQGNYMPPKEITVTVTPTSPATGVVLQYRQADATLIATATLPDGSPPEFGFCHAWSEDAGFSGKEMRGGTARVPLMAGSWFVGCDTYNPMTNKFYRSNEVQIAVSKGSEVSRSFPLEEGLFEVPKGYTETFDATTQKVITLPDGTTVTIPASALGSSGNITFIAEPDINLFHTKDTKPINFAWNFEALDSNQQLVQSFNSNVTICIPYDQAYLDMIDVEEGSIVAKYYNTSNGTWQLPNGVTQDFDANKVCFSVSHFTNFALATGSQIGATTAGYIVATPIGGGGPQVTVWDGSGNRKLSFFAYASTLRLGIQAVAGDVDGDGTNEIIVSPGRGAGPQVRIFNLQGRVIKQFFVFASSFRGGARLAVADVDGDGKDEIIVTAKTGGGPQVRIFDGNGTVEKQFFVYDSSFRGGVELVTGDVDSDGLPEIITVPASAAGSQVRVFDYDGTVVLQFFAYARTVRGGYHVTTGDVNNDGSLDIIVTTGPGLGPQVAMFTGSGSLINRVMAYASTFRGGLFASVGDVTGDGLNEIVVTPESQAGPQVRVLTYRGTVVSQFFAYASRLRGAFSSVVADVDQDGTNEIVTAPGAGMGPQVRVFNYRGTAEKSFFTHHTGFRGGITISTVPVF